MGFGRENLKRFYPAFPQKAGRGLGDGVPKSQPAGCEIPRENAGRRSRGISDSEAQEREQKQSGGLFLPGKPSLGVSPKALAPHKPRASERGSVRERGQAEAQK